VLNVSAPGNFEQHMPGIAQWFADHPPGDTRLSRDAGGSAAPFGTWPDRR
jgi:hypothetical protein